MGQYSHVTVDLWRPSCEFQWRLEHVQHSWLVPLVGGRCTRVHRREGFLWSYRRMFPVSSKQRIHRRWSTKQDIVPDEILTNADDCIGMFHSDQVLIVDDRSHCLDYPRTRPSAEKKCTCPIEVLRQRIGRFTSKVYLDMPREILCLSQNPSGLTMYTCSIL